MRGNQPNVQQTGQQLTLHSNISSHARCISTVPRLQISTGTEPFKLLRSSVNTVNLVNKPSSDGTVPVNEFLSRYNKFKAVYKEPKLVGRVPENELYGSQKAESFVQSNSWVGSVPFIELPPKCKYCNSCNNPSSVGIGSIILVLDKSRWVNFESRQISEGKGPFDIEFV